MRGRAVAAALFLVLAAGASGCSAAGTRHEVTLEGVLPNRLAPVWSTGIETDFAAGGVAANVFAITDTAVVLPVSDGDLTVRDPGTGKVQWSAGPDRGWTFSGDAVIGNRLYAYMTTRNENVIRFIAYDLGTGSVVWRTQLVVDLYRGVGLQTVMFTTRGIVVQLGVANQLYGLRLSDGKGIWLARLPASCPAGDSTAAPSAAIFLLECTGSGVRLDSVDPATGRISWQRTLAVSRTAVYPIDLASTNAGEIVAEAGSTMRIFTSGGHLIATRVPPVSCPGGTCMIGSEGSEGVLQLGTNSSVVQGIDLTTGQVKWHRPGDLIASGIDSAISVDSGGTLFAPAGPFFIGDQSELLPAFVLAMRAETGRGIVLPLPLASTSGASLLVGTADGLLFVQSEGPRNPSITAFRPEHVTIAGPVSLGGVASAEWPDACALLTPADLRFISPGYVSSPRPVILSGVSWPKPVTCAYVGTHADDPAVTLTVGWIADSAGQANELVASDLAILGTTSQPPPRIPGGYLVHGSALGGGADRALVVAGRAIVEVTVPGNPGDARRLAPIVAARLQAIYG